MWVITEELKAGLCCQVENQSLLVFVMWFVVSPTVFLLIPEECVCPCEDIETQSVSQNKRIAQKFYLKLKLKFTAGETSSVLSESKTL